jgi:hypothetical protein
MRRAVFRFRYIRIKTGPPQSDAEQLINILNNKKIKHHIFKCKSLQAVVDVPKNRNRQVPSTAQTHGGVLRSQAAECDGVRRTGLGVI